MKKLQLFGLALLSLFLLAQPFFAQDDKTSGIPALGVAVKKMCNELVCLLPVLAMLMIIGAGVVYAAGQMMGAETRARANTWATAMLLGALIAILIVEVAPPVLKALYPSWGTTTCACVVSSSGIVVPIEDDNGSIPDLGEDENSEPETDG